MLYGAAAVLFAVVYLVVMRHVTRFAAAAFGENVAVIEAGLLVFSLIVFQPLLLGLEDLLEGMVRRRDRTDPQRIVQDLARAMAAEVDLAGLRGRITTTLKQGLLVDNARLLTVEESAGSVRLGDGMREGVYDAASPEAELVRFFESAPEPALQQDVLRSIRRFAESEEERLHSWVQDCRLLVPIERHSKLRGVLGIGAKVTGGRFHAEDIGLLALLGQQIGMSLENLRLLSENLAKRLLEEEIQLASEIQKGLLPTQFPRRPGYETHAMSLSSKEVGGDYFDIFSIDGRILHLAIADVSGKGVPAAMLMASLRAALRSNVEHLDSPAAVLERLNRLLYESTSPEKFATFFYGTLDTENHELVYANAGHNYPILVRADGSTVELADGGLVLGVFPEARYIDGKCTLKGGETLFLYTDGITEATNGGDEEFGPERLMALLSVAVGGGPERLVAQVLAEVRAFAPGADIADDMTMVVVQRAVARTRA
jgi:serine phosphatase RsbU (regulator of sigma subunit)